MLVIQKKKKHTWKHKLKKNSSWHRYLHFYFCGQKYSGLFNITKLRKWIRVHSECPVFLIMQYCITPCRFLKNVSYHVQVKRKSKKF